MSEPAGYDWRIEAADGSWLWSIRTRQGTITVLKGRADTRPHAAACVVHALIVGVTEAREPQKVAA